MRALARLAAIIALLAAGGEARAQPVPPCPSSAGAAVKPAYGDLGAPPAVQTWCDIDLGDSGSCLGPARDRVALVIALAGRFDGAKSMDDIATRIGAISATNGLRYWSTTDRRWRTLIADAFAIDDPVARRRRPDFTAREILSGRTLYFAQNDTRSTGLNVYSLAARSVAPDRLVVEIVNLTTIRFAFVELFQPRALRSVHFVERLDANAWGYYGVSAVWEDAGNGHEKSFVNRAVAFYRFLIGVPGDAAPPLAP